jgi:hypothetical protein
MGKWSYSAVEKRKDFRIAHLFLAGVALLGFGFLIIGLAGIAQGAPSGYNNPVKLGHNPGDIEGGTFFQDSTNPTDSTKHRWIFPGVVSILNTAPVNQIALFINQAATGTGMYAIHAISSIAQVARFESASNGGTQIGLISTEAGGKEYRIGTGINNPGDFIIRNQSDGADRIVVDGSFVGINNGTPTQALDVSGQIHATGDICTDVDGGVCVGQGISFVPDPTQSQLHGLRIVCQPDCLISSLTAPSKTYTAICPAGYVPLNCSGQVKAAAGQTLTEYAVYSLYTGAGESINGCELKYNISGPAGTPTGFLKAVCVYVG